MDELKKILENLSPMIDLMSTIFTGILALLMYLTTKKLNKQQLEITSRQDIPDPHIISITQIKSEIPASGGLSLSQANHCRIQQGDTQINLTLNDQIPAFSANSLNEFEPAYLPYCKSHDPGVFFLYIKQTPHLCIKHELNKEQFIIDFNNCQVLLKNYGAEMVSLAITRYEVVFCNKQKSNLILWGNAENKIVITPEENKSGILLYIDEITTEFQDAVCLVNPTIYSQMPSELDILKLNVNNNFLQYDKMIFECECTNRFNQVFKYEITIAYNGYTYISQTTRKM